MRIDPDPTDPAKPIYSTHPTDPTYLTWAVVAACLPDLDFFWGRHNMETHSVGFALLIALAVFAWRRDARLALICALAVGTHIVFDWLGSDDSPPIGVMAWWPFSNGFYFANLFVFDAISRRYWLPGFLRHNVLAVLREIAILLPIAAVLWIWRRQQPRAHADVQRSGIRDRGSAPNRQ
jgi:membrane-bound metal-dependent hydrolase YbcI (DUF457 family)